MPSPGIENGCTLRPTLLNCTPRHKERAMSRYLDATVKNPRWWIILPFILGVMLPLVAVQMGLRLVSFLSHWADQRLEALGHALHKPVHAWWRDEALRRQGRLHLGADV